MTLQLSPREAQLMALFEAKPERPIAELRAIYKPIPRGTVLRSLDKSITSLVTTLSRKLAAQRKGSITRINARGRGHRAIYLLKRR